MAIDDQDHIHDALKNGDVTGCVTTLPTATRGCVAEPLGLMRYRCRAASALIAQSAPSGGAVQPHQLLASSAVIFSRKDARQDAFLAQHLNLKNARYPRHFVPAVDASEHALVLGMGWGMTSCWTCTVTAAHWPRSCPAARWTWRCIGSTKRTSRCWLSG